MSRINNAGFDVKIALKIKAVLYNMNDNKGLFYRGVNFASMLWSLCLFCK